MMNDKDLLALMQSIYPDTKCIPPNTRRILEAVVAEAIEARDIQIKRLTAALSARPEHVSCAVALKAKDREIERLTAQLVEAIEDIESWGDELEDHFKEMWDFAGCVARHNAALAPNAGAPPNQSNDMNGESA